MKNWRPINWEDWNAENAEHANKFEMAKKRHKNKTKSTAAKGSNIKVKKTEKLKRAKRDKRTINLDFPFLLSLSGYSDNIDFAKCLSSLLGEKVFVCEVAQDLKNYYSIFWTAKSSFPESAEVRRKMILQEGFDSKDEYAEIYKDSEIKERVKDAIDKDNEDSSIGDTVFKGRTPGFGFDEIDLNKIGK